MFDLDFALKTVYQRNGSDLHLSVGEPPMVRVVGELEPVDSEALTSADMDSVFDKVLSDNRLETLQAIDDVNHHRNLSKTCNSVKDVMEDLKD